MEEQLYKILPIAGPAYQPSWADVYEIIANIENLPEALQTSARATLDFLKTELGIGFFNTCGRNHPIHQKLMMAGGEAQLKELIKWTTVLQQLKKSSNDYQYLLDKLRSKDRCRSEGMPFVDIAATYLSNGFNVNFPTEIQDQTTPDIELIFQPTGEKLFIEVSRINDSDDRVAQDRLYRSLVNLCLLYGYSLPVSGKLHALIPEAELLALMETIKLLKDDAATNRTVANYRDQYLSIAFAHPEAITQLDEWSDTYKLPMRRFDGFDVNYNYTSGIIGRGRIKKEAKQIPAGKPGILYFPVHVLYPLSTDIAQTVAAFAAHLEPFTNIYFTDDPNLRNLMAWWRYQGGEAKPDFLCLLVSGGLKFNRFFEHFLEQIQTLDLVSGVKMAIFLYAKDVGNVLKDSIDDQARANHRARTFNYLKYSEINKKARPEIESGLFDDSYEYSKCLVDFFRLETEDQPCVLILSRTRTEPWVISLKTESDARNLYDIIETIVRLKHSESAIKEDADLTTIGEQLLKSKEELQRLTTFEMALKEQIITAEQSVIAGSAALLQQLSQSPGGKELLWQYIANLSRHNFHFKTFASHPDLLAHQNEIVENETLVHELGKNAFSAIRKDIRKIHRSTQLLNRHQLQIERLKETIRQYELEKSKKIEFLKQLPALCQEINEKIDETVKKYNKRFKAKKKYLQLKEFMDEVFSWVKGAKDAKDLLNSK
jgi:hypothetical protein